MLVSSISMYTTDETGVLGVPAERTNGTRGQVARAAVASSLVAVALDDCVAELFDNRFARLFRYLDRLSGDRELAADIVQESFARLHANGSLPDEPET